MEKGPIKKMKRRATPGCDVNSIYLREREIGEKEIIKNSKYCESQMGIGQKKNWARDRVREREKELAALLDVVPLQERKKNISRHLINLNLSRVFYFLFFFFQIWRAARLTLGGKFYLNFIRRGVRLLFVTFVSFTF